MNIQPRSNSDEMERRKNELVRGMLHRIRPFMSPSGQLREDADYDAYAALMESETQFVQRTLLLTVLQSVTQPAVFKAFARSEKLVKVLAEWLAESIKLESPMLGKLLDVLHNLPLNVDQLVEHRLGKTAKKLLTTEHITQEIRDKTAELCENWTRLAKMEDKRRNSTEISSNKTIDKDTTRRSSEPASKDIANTSLPNEIVPPVPLVKTRAEQILERAARGELAKTTPASRPLSADDIHKAKRRQQYLSEAGMEDVKEKAVDLEVDDVRPAKRVKKRVSFANDVDLVQIRYFEPAEDEAHPHGQVDLHQMDRNEASFAFKQMARIMDAEIDWKPPNRLQIGVEERGKESTEKETQSARERTALSVLYFSLDDIPPSPSEAILAEELPASAINVKRIPLRDIDGRVTTVVRHVQPPQIASPVVAVNTDLLSSLLKDPSAFQDLLKNVPPATNKGAIPPQRTPTPPLPMMMPPGMRPPGKMAPRSIPPETIPLGRMPPRAMPPGMMMPPMPGILGMPGMPGMPPPPFGMPMPLMSFPPPPFIPPLPTVAQPSKGKRKVPCKFYRKGDPNSCRFGTSCQFLHADH